MDLLFKIDWQSMFVPTESILEIVIRGTIMYLAMYFLLRIFRRQSGNIGIADLLVIVVIADAAQNGIKTASRSLRDLRVAEVDKLDCKIEGSKVVYRAKLKVSFKFHGDD